MKEYQDTLIYHVVLANSAVGLCHTYQFQLANSLYFYLYHYLFNKLD